MQHSAFYDTDLAATHAAAYADMAQQASVVLLDLLGRSGHHSGTVVDLGCGSGDLAHRVSEAGYDVLGVDLSAAMVELAKARAPRARIVQGSVWDVEPPEAVAVTAIGEVCNYVTDLRAGPAQLQQLVSKVHARLAPGGVLLFDLATPGRAGPSGIREVVADHADATVWMRATESADHRSMQRRIVLFRREGTRYRRSDETHQLHLYDTAEVTAALQAVGFEVSLIDGYGDLTFPEGLVGFQASRVAAGP